MESSFSGFARFHMALKGKVIKDLFGVEVPKYVVWWRYGRRINRDTLDVMQNKHSDYKLSRKK